MISAPVFCRRFIGRDSELQVLHDRYHDALSGRGSIVLIGGDAGIGKTRFLREARDRLEHEGARLVFGQCLLHSQSPLAPIVDALRELDAVDPIPLRTIPRLQTALARLFPDLQAAQLPFPQNDDRRVQFGAIIEALRQFAATTPVIVAIEDIHWADLATLEFLQYAADRTASTKLVLITTFRTDELHAQHPLTAFLGRVSPRDSWTLTLPPLCAWEMRVLAADALEDRAPLPETQLESIVALAEGSPLFAEELLRHATDAAEASADVELPLSVRAAVLERIAALDAGDRATLSYAAAIGRRFSTDVLTKIRGNGIDRIGALLRRVRDLQLIQEERKAPGNYVFRHALVQEALYGELLRDEARAIHLHIATELEMLEHTEECVMALAHHWGVAREPEKAARYNIAAGDLAAIRLAYDDAVRFYERALEFVPADSEAQGEVYEKLAQALNFAAPGEHTRRAVENSLAYYERLADRRKVAALLLAYVCTQCALGARSVLEERRSRALEAISQAAPEDPLYFAALVEFAAQHALRGEPDAAQRFIERVEAFSGMPAPRATSRFYNFRGIWHALEGHTSEMVADFERAAQLASNAGDRFSHYLARNNLGFCAMKSGEFDIASRAFEDAIQLARDLFNVDYEAYALAGNAEAAFLKGDLPLARRLVLESKDVSPNSANAGVRVQLASIAIPLGIRLADGELVDRFACDEIVEIALDTKEAQRIGPICSAFAELFAERGADDQAPSLLQRGASVIESIANSPALAIAIAERGLTAKMPRVRLLLERWAAPAESRMGRASLALFDTFVEKTNGRDPRALANDARRRFAELGCRFYEAIALELADRPRDAMALYRAMGNVRDERRLTASLTPVNRLGRLKNELTAREREIARLIADGKSNRAIAETLLVSERTVESHVAAILNKFAAHSRAEIAARVARRQDDIVRSS